MSMTTEEFRPYLRSTVRQVINPDLVIQVFDDVLRAAVTDRDREWTHALHHAQENTPGGGEFRSSPTGPDIALCEEMFIGHEAAAILAEKEAWLAACREVSGWYPEGVFDPDGQTLDTKSAAMARLTVKNVQETRARTAQEEEIKS